MIELMLLSTALMIQDQDTKEYHQEAKQEEMHSEEMHQDEEMAPAGVTGEARELFLLADEATRKVHTATFDMVSEGTGSQA